MPKNTIYAASDLRKIKDMNALEIKQRISEIENEYSEETLNSHILKEIQMLSDAYRILTGERIKIKLNK